MFEAQNLAASSLKRPICERQKKSSPPGQYSSTKNSLESLWNAQSILTIKGCRMFSYKINKILVIGKKLNIHTKILLSVIVCSTWFLLTISAFFNTLRAYNYPVSFFLTSMTLPYEPFPSTEIISKSFFEILLPVLDYYSVMTVQYYYLISSCCSADNS